MDFSTLVLRALSLSIVKSLRNLEGEKNLIVASLLGVFYIRCAKLPNSMKTFPYRMNVRKIHKLYFGVWIIIGTLATTSTSSIRHSSCVGSRIDYQYFL